jgi:hypothetical protein
MNVVLGDHAKEMFIFPAVSNSEMAEARISGVVGTPLPGKLHVFLKNKGDVNYKKPVSTGRRVWETIV